MIAPLSRLPKDEEEVVLASEGEELYNEDGVERRPTRWDTEHFEGRAVDHLVSNAPRMVKEADLWTKEKNIGPHGAEVQTPNGRRYVQEHKTIKEDLVVHQTRLHLPRNLEKNHGGCVGIDRQGKAHGIPRKRGMWERRGLGRMERVQ